jgi:hypothetical protein
VDVSVSFPRHAGRWLTPRVGAVPVWSAMNQMEEAIQLALSLWKLFRTKPLRGTK